MSNKSLLDIAYEIILNCEEPIAFKDLWVKVCECEELDANLMEGKIGKFYTSLLTDGRFVNLGDNTWDLRSRYTFDKVHIDMSDCYSDEEYEVELEDLLEEKDDDDLYKDEDDSEFDSEENESEDL
jgi:DNA-directed RNA polymerase subunit delta